MIELRRLRKEYRTRTGVKVVADDIDAVFGPRETVGLLGRNGAGKSTLLQIIAGTIDHDGGEVVHAGSVSWPVGFAGAFHADLTGAQNTKFVARVYGVDGEDLADFVEDFAELGSHFHMPFRTYSSGMRSRLSFGVSMGIDFDHYLMDEVTAVGDQSFRAKCEAVLLNRMSTRGAVMVTHSMPQVQRLCDRVGVLDRGRLHMFDDVEEGLAFHAAVMAAESPDVA